jgi:hypothetical protein
MTKWKSEPLPGREHEPDCWIVMVSKTRTRGLGMSCFECSKAVFPSYYDAQEFGDFIKAGKPAVYLCEECCRSLMGDACADDALYSKADCALVCLPGVPVPPEPPFKCGVCQCSVTMRATSWLVLRSFDMPVVCPRCSAKRLQESTCECPCGCGGDIFKSGGVIHWPEDPACWE